MYVVLLETKDDKTRFVSKINYKKEFWECDLKPKIFIKKQNALKCRNQVFKWAIGYKSYSVCELKYVDIIRR